MIPTVPVAHGWAEPLRAPKLSRFEQNLPLAASVLATKGFGQVGLRELASAMGLSCGALYHHIPSKEQLLYELIHGHYEVLMAILLPVRSPRATFRRQALAGCLQQVLEHYRAHPAGFVLAVRDRHYLSPALLEHLQVTRAELGTALAQIIHGARAKRAIAHAVMECFEAFPLWLNSLDTDLADTARVYSELIMRLVDTFPGGLDGQP